ncbi:hypothetical protein Tco_0468298 [Tanacetum coccineum]
MLQLPRGRTNGCYANCTQPKRLRILHWYKEKAKLAKLRADKYWIRSNSHFLARSKKFQQVKLRPHPSTDVRFIGLEDLDTYDSDCDDLSTAQAVLMANISNYGSTS